MTLEIQIQSLMFSLFFGMFYAFACNAFYGVLFKGKKIIRMIINLIFQILIFLLYFILLKIINSGIVHWYFILMLSVGFVIGNIKTSKLRKLS